MKLLGDTPKVFDLSVPVDGGSFSKGTLFIFSVSEPMLDTGETGR